MPEYQDAYGTDATGKPFRSEDEARRMDEVLRRNLQQSTTRL